MSKAKTTVAKMPANELWPQVVGFALARREGDAARRLALAIFRDITGSYPTFKWGEVAPQECSREVRNYIVAKMIRAARLRAVAKGAPA